MEKLTQKQKELFDKILTANLSEEELLAFMEKLKELLNKQKE